MLIVFGGLPGVGKTSLSREMAEQVGATYLRIDTIEQAMRRPDDEAEIGPAGYLVAYAVAEDNLKAGNIVIADAVNGLQVIRTAWRRIAARVKCRIVEIEVVCSDEAVHRRRVEQRRPDIAGHVLPDWQAVLDRPYESWEPPAIRIDTAKRRADVIVEDLVEQLGLDG